LRATSGRLTTRADAQANLRWDRTYEANTGRLDTQVIKNDSSGATLASFDLAYDPAGNVISKTSSVFSNSTAPGAIPTTRSREPRIPTSD
jgi:hypothetical protein